MKTAVSIPDQIFEDAEQLAVRLGYSRSQLYAEAVKSFIASQGEDPVTAALNALADQDESDLADGLDQQARALIDAGHWKW